MAHPFKRSVETRRKRTRNRRSGIRGEASLRVRTRRAGPDNGAALLAKVRAGLPYKEVERFQKIARLSPEELSALVGIPRRTLSRRKLSGKLSTQESDRLIRASQLFEKIVGLFDGDVAAASRWLRSPQRAFGWETPFSMAQTEVGAREVEDLVGRLEYGVYT